MDEISWLVLFRKAHLGSFSCPSPAHTSAFAPACPPPSPVLPPPPFPPPAPFLARSFPARDRGLGAGVPDPDRRPSRLPPLATGSAASPGAPAAAACSAGLHRVDALHRAAAA